MSNGFSVQVLINLLVLNIQKSDQSSVSNAGKQSDTISACDHEYKKQESY